MRITLETSRPIPIAKIKDLDGQFDITVISILHCDGFYLRLANFVLWVASDENGNAIFKVPGNAQIPWPVIEVVQHHFNCIMQQGIDRRIHEMTPFELQEPIVAWLGEGQLTPADNLVRRLRGQSNNIEDGSEWDTKAKIAAMIVATNPGLGENANLPLLLTLTDDAHDAVHFDIDGSPPISHETDVPESADYEAQQVEEFLAGRRKAGLLIDPATAEVTWWYAQTLDPYGIDPVPAECWQVGREYFARAPGSDTWVHFDDLPEATSTALWKRHRYWLSFPSFASSEQAAIEESEQWEAD